MTGRQFAFVVGCARSGTTALTRLLNRHPDVAIGYERFSGPARRSELAPELYAPARFRDFRPRDTHRMGYADAERASVLDKIETARVVGDKLPQLVGRLAQLERFPDVKVIVILREPTSVARSFDVRATNARDTDWDAGRDRMVAIRDFNRAVAMIENLETRWPFAYMTVPYEQLFGDGVGVRDMLDFLDVDPDRLGPIDDILTRSETLRAEGRGVNDLAQLVALRADYTRYRAAIETAFARLGVEV